MVDATSHGMVDATSYGMVDATSYGMVDATSCGMVDATSYGMVDATSYGMVDATSYCRVDATFRFKTVTKPWNGYQVELEEDRTKKPVYNIVMPDPASNVDGTTIKFISEERHVATVKVDVGSQVTVEFNTWLDGQLDESETVELKEWDLVFSLPPFLYLTSNRQLPLEISVLSRGSQTRMEIAIGCGWDIPGEYYSLQS